MEYIAHRGSVTKDIKDNSLESFKRAIESDCYIGIETDIRVTKDNVYILYHDSLFKGKLVKNTLYREFKEEGILRLSDLLKMKTDKIMLLEIKDFDIDIDAFLKFLDKYKRNIYLMSFSDKVIEKIYAKKTKYKIGVLNYILNTKDVYKYDFICLLTPTLSEYVIDVYKKMNVKVIGYGVKNNKLTFDITYIVDDNIFQSK